MAFEQLSTAPSRIILQGSGMSGRGIQFRVLDPEEKREVEMAAARTAGKDANGGQIYQIGIRDGMTRIIMAITEQCGVKDVADPDVTWRKVSAADLNNPLGDCYFWSKTLFTTRDIEFIEAIYTRLHSVNKDEFDTVMGKAVKVSGD